MPQSLAKESKKQKNYKCEIVTMKKSTRQSFLSQRNSLPRQDVSTPLQSPSDLHCRTFEPPKLNPSSHVNITVLGYVVCSPCFVPFKGALMGPHSLADSKKKCDSPEFLWFSWHITPKPSVVNTAIIILNYGWRSRAVVIIGLKASSKGLSFES